MDMDGAGAVAASAANGDGGWLPSTSASVPDTAIGGSITDAAA